MEDDEIMREIDIVFSQANSNDGDTSKSCLYLLQYPTKPSSRAAVRTVGGRLRPKSQIIETDIPLPGGQFFDQNIEEERHSKKLKYASRDCSVNANYVIGVLRENKLHLVTLSGIKQMEPTLKHLDEKDAKRKAKEHRGKSQQNDTDEPKVIKAHTYKQRESARTIAHRAKSAKYMRDQLEADRWLPLQVHAEPESYLTFEETFFHGRYDRPASVADSVSRDLSASQYLNAIAPQRVVDDQTRAVDDNYRKLDRQQLLKMSPKERVREILVCARVTDTPTLKELGHISEFKSVEHLAMLFAALVQGKWVVHSALVLEDKYEQLCRDYILGSLQTHDAVTHAKIKEVAPRISHARLKEILEEVAVLDRSLQPRAWRLRPTAHSYRSALVAPKYSLGEVHIALSKLGNKLATAQYERYRKGKRATSSKRSVPKATTENAAPKGFEGCVVEIFKARQHRVCTLQKMMQLANAIARRNKLPDFTVAKMRSILESEKYHNTRGRFCMKCTSNRSVCIFDRIRAAALKLFETKETITRADVRQATKGQKMSHPMFLKVMRSIAVCGTDKHWRLLHGDDRDSAQS